MIGKTTYLSIEMMLMTETVVVLGASPKPERYSNQAIRLLTQHGHRVIPVNPAQETIEGLAVAKHMGAIGEHIDTVTMYVSPEHSKSLASDIIALKPKRVIFNPGTESTALENELEAAGIDTEQACTLVLLRTGQY